MDAQPMVLAKNDDQSSYIMICKHNLVHLTWHQAKLQMHPSDLASIAEFLRGAEAILEPNHYCSSEDHFVMECPQGHCVTWLLGLGLHISRAELSNITNLTNEALNQLNQQRKLSVSSQTRFPDVFNIYQIRIDDCVIIQINWSQITLRLSFTEFLNAVSFLHCAADELIQHTRFGGGEHFVERDKQGSYQLWLHGMGLYLTQENFTYFLRMITKAEIQIKQHVQHKAQPLQDLTPAGLSAWYSLN